ncbi:hypothetical protein KJ762_10935 [bacterium]|nr:hypothetical protein [bacterium]MBU1064966.1 hypothetical protein [bacterium]MBU1635010.1 hypothetical protein [bacterium]MBU1872734.1 hypothetical protein [bacterium]
MRHSNSKDFFSALADPKNFWVIVIVVFINLAIFVSGRLYINPYLSRKPCVTCGRPDTKAVTTLWQYEINVIPVCRDVKLWYCKRHIRSAPEIVKVIPSEKDTIPKRYIQAVIGGVLQMMTLFYALVLLRFDMKLFFLSPLLIGLAFLLGNTTSSLSLTLLFGSIIVLPGLLFYIWSKQGNI